MLDWQRGLITVAASHAMALAQNGKWHERRIYDLLFAALGVTPVWPYEVRTHADSDVAPNVRILPSPP